MRGVFLIKHPCFSMLSKKYRITSGVDFNRLIREGNSRNNSFFYLKFLLNNIAYSRFGFAIGVKLFNGAVKRNRVKRLLGEVVRVNFKKIRGGYDIVIGVKSEKINKMKYLEAERSLLVFLGNNNFLK